jgi:hypothetical protein
MSFGVGHCCVKRIIFTDARRTKIVSAVVTIFIGSCKQPPELHGLPPIDRAGRQQECDPDDHDQRDQRD